MSTDISFAKLTIEARTEVIKEAMESTLWSLEKSEKEIEFLRARLQEQKEALGHGRWLPWIRETFGDDNATIRKIQRFIQKPNATLLTYLDGSESSGNSGELVPREARKPGRVKVVEPPADHSGDTNKKVDGGSDDDPTPDPPTIRKTAAGCRKVPESEKPKTRPVQAELLPDEPEVDPVEYWLSQHAIDEILARWVDVVAFDGSPKKTAKELRKLADKLDPPTKFRRPDLEEVSAYFAELKAADPDSFFDFYESKGWMVGMVSMKDWRASARKWVRENQANGKGNSNGHKANDVDDYIKRQSAKLRATFGCD